MKRIMALLVALLFMAMAGSAMAADATGTWKWTTTRGGKSLEATAKLKQEGDKVTGVYVGGQSNTESAIENGSVKGDTISFTVSRERNGQKRTTKYTGTIKDDTITGKSEGERDGQVQSSDWVAKRQK
jgi:hypothetical protein